MRLSILQSLLRPGIKGKLSWLFLVCTILPLGLLGYYAQNITGTALSKNVVVADVQNTYYLKIRLQQFFERVPEDIAALSRFHSLHQLLYWQDIGEPYKTREHLDNIQHIFEDFLQSRTIYRDLQVMDLQGVSLLRIVLKDGKAEVLPAHAQADIKQTEYFKAALKLPPQGIYMSHLMTVKESDSGETQRVPIIRYAVPVIDSNEQKRGVLAISLYANSFLSLISEHENAHDSEQQGTHVYRLINHRGDYIYRSPLLREESQARFDEFSEEQPSIWKEMTESAQGHWQDDSKIFSYQHIFPLPEDSSKFWVLYQETRGADALAQVLNFRLIFIAMLVAVGILVLFVSSWFTRRMLHPLMEVNRHLKALASGRVPEQTLSYQSSDEIGEIITATQEVSNSIRKTIEQTNAIASGKFDAENLRMRDKDDMLGRSLLYMTTTLRDAMQRNEAQDWLKTGQTRLNEEISGDQSLQDLSQKVISFLSSYLKVQLGAFYLLEKDSDSREEHLVMLASYAYSKRKQLSNRFALGEGVIGQAALERQPIFIADVPEDYVKIQSALGDAHPAFVLVMPFLYEDEVKGVLEFGSFTEFSETQFEFLMQIMPALAVAVNSAQARTTMQTLLEQTQSQAEELQSQAEELQTQQEELRQTNEELETRSYALQEQKERIREKNQELERSQKQIEAKAREVEMASRYKSEFLANMSHELRTPLNSLLILAQMLSTNKDGNLTGKQVEYAKTIHSAGTDLLSLINEILDLSKVEAGKMEVNIDPVLCRDFLEGMEMKFRHVAEDKGLYFKLDIMSDLPEQIQTDSHRLKQIINNLLSNAFKFTGTGGITLRVQRPDPVIAKSLHLNPARSLGISVIDTGIGIAENKQKAVFEAFQQADGTTSRKYGGTGLGLSISRQLSQLLGGDLVLQSEEGKGSCFTLYLPETAPIGKPTPASANTAAPHPAPQATTPEPSTPPTDELLLDAPSLPAPIAEPELPAEPTEHPNPLNDDRAELQAGDRFVLIIDDDEPFGSILMETAREKSFKVVYSNDGKSGLALAEELQPDAIILDVGLPQLDGLSVMERLKNNPQTRHIPVHFISASDEGLDARRMGAIGYLLKPLDMEQLGEAFRKIERFIAKTIKSLLLVIEDEQRSENISQLVAAAEVQPVHVSSGAEALALLHTANGESIDCLILDVDARGSGASAFDLLEKLQADDDSHLAQIPVIVYATRELSPEEDAQLQTLSEHMTVKAVRSPERLLDEATLFLHQLEAKLPSEQREMLHRVHDRQAILTERKVLLVDDDMRNTFALATVLEDNEMEVLVAKNGQEALDMLAEEEGIDIVLMDIMMPEMDGFEAMRRIREQKQFHKLPIIALTAKAMRGDKAKCIEAGANDYLTKPVDTDKLLSLMRVWLYQ